MVKKTVHRILPPDDFKPRSLGLVFGVSTLIPFIAGLVLILPFAFLAGMDIGGVVVAYFNDAMVVLSPLIILLVVYWLMYWYIYSLCVPVNECVERGKSLAYACLFEIRAIFSGGWLPTFTPSFGIARIPIYPIERIATALPRLRRSLGLPRHLALGWIPGAHPQIVYH